MKKTNILLKCLSVTSSIGLLSYANAASTMTNVGWEWLGAQNAAGTNHDISVFAGSAGYAGTDDASAATSGTFGDGTVEAYAFFNAAEGVDPGFGDGDEVLNIYASGGSSITTTTIGNIQQNNGSADIWTDTDPAGFTSTADFTSNTLALGLLDSNWEGSIDISAYESGTVYFIYGHYRGGGLAANNLDLTMRDTDLIASDVLLVNAGTTDQPNNWEHYVSEISFVNDEGHDVIDYVFDFNGNGRITGIVVDGVVPIPEPSSTALLGLGGLALILRRRR